MNTVAVVTGCGGQVALPLLGLLGVAGPSAFLEAGGPARGPVPPAAPAVPAAPADRLPVGRLPIGRGQVA